MSGAAFRPIAMTDAQRSAASLPLAGGPVWFDRAERLVRQGLGRNLVPLADIPAALRDRLSAPRPPICGLSLDRPRLMAVLNVTPDSFSDGGRYQGFNDAVTAGRALAEAGADILDIGGESTRPGAEPVPEAVEIERTIPVIAALREQGVDIPISIDTRKAGVARAALAVGANLINDVSALGHDRDMITLLANSRVPVCLMHAAGDTRTMQQNPVYDDVLPDVFDYLAARIRLAESRGIGRDRILADPGIGFGKTLEHNLALIRGLSLFHGLGCALLLGVSRKRFIGTIGRQPQADLRAPGSIALGLEGLRQGVQMLRVHDIAETRQAVALWRAVNMQEPEASS